MNETTSFYDEPARRLTVLAETDVLVLGGGPGGVGAAVAAARNGARTILVERFGSFGGTWTAGILSAIMPFPFVKGIFTEVIRELSQRDGWLAWNDSEGAGGGYDSETIKMVLDELILRAGVQPLFFTQVVEVIRDGDRLRGVIVESKEGRHAILAKQIIDASGDGDVCVRAGVSYDVGREKDGAVQPMTMIFKMEEVDDALFSDYLKKNPNLEEDWKKAKARGEITIPREDLLASKNPKKGQWAFNTTRIIGKDGTKVVDVTEAMIEGRRQVREVADFLQKYIPGFEKAVVSETAPHIGVRETRRIHCDYTVTADDIIQTTSFDDSIARGNWFIDIHSPTGEGTERIYPPEGKWYEIPYRSLRARGIENLLIASRCIDSTHEAHATIRITPQVMAIGEGAGTAAALCVKQGLKSTRDLDPTILRETLRNQEAMV
jgi:ribulose 1,5-bisphosphate synthetase/thiazole synthase